MNAPKPPLPLSHDILTWPNLLSFMRIGLVPVFLACLFDARFGWAFIIFIVASISDGLDGYLARKLNQRTYLGQVLDPIGDKLLMFGSYVVLAIPGHGFEPIPLWLSACVIGRDVAIVTVALIIYLRTGFHDFKPSWPGKVSTVVQICYITLFLLAHNVTWFKSWIPAGNFITLAVTAYSGFYYIFFVRRGIRVYHESVGKRPD